MLRPFWGAFITGWAGIGDLDFGDQEPPILGNGGSALIATALVGWTEGLSPVVVLIVLMVITMTLSDVLNNVATALVAAPILLVTGVAEGNYAAGITLDKVARANVAKGAPIEMIWPAWPSNLSTPSSISNW